MSRGGEHVRRLDSDTCWRISSALGDARAAFLDYAQSLDEIAAHLRAGGSVTLWADGEHGARAADGMAAQFRRQATEAAGLAELFAAAESCALSFTLDPDGVG